MCNSQHNAVNVIIHLLSLKKKAIKDQSDKINVSKLYWKCVEIIPMNKRKIEN